MKFKVFAELEGESHLIRGINYTLFTKEFEIEIPEETIIDRAFNVPKVQFVIEHNGMGLIVDSCHDKLLHAVGMIGRSQSSHRVFERLEELGWKFREKAAKKMDLPPMTGPKDDTFIWERLAA